MPQRPSKWPSLDRGLIAVGLLGFAVRLLYVLESGDDPSFGVPIIDASQYHDLGKALAGGGDPWNGPFTRPPLYPYLLAGVYRLVGPSLTAARMLQALLGGGTCVLTCLLGRRLFDRRVGFVGGLIVALYGPLVFHDGRLQASCLVVFCFLLALLATIRAARRQTWSAWLACGVALGVAALARPNVVLFAGVAAFWIVLAGIRQRRWARMARHGLALVAGCAATITPATIRNFAASGEFVLITPLAGINLYLGNNTEADRTIAIRPGPEWDQLMRRPHAGGNVSAQQANDYFVGRALSYVRDQPGEFLGGLARKARRFCSAAEIPRNYDLYGHRIYSGTLWLLLWRLGSFAFPFGILFPPAVVGLVLACRGRSDRTLAAGFVVACGLSVIVFFNASRYRAPIVPVLAIFASWSVLWLIGEIRAARWRRALTSATGMLAVGALVNLPVRTPYDGIDFEADLHYCVGGRLQQQGDLAGAERALGHALRRTPDSAKLHVSLSRVALAQGRRDDAVRLGRSAVRLEPDMADARIALGWALTQAGQRDDGMNELQRAVELDPAHADAHATMASALARQQRFGRAIDHYRQAIHYYHDRPEYHLGLASALVFAGRQAEALDVLESAASETSNPDILDALAWNLATSPDEARRDCQRALALARRVASGRAIPRYLDTLAAALACNGQFTQAVSTASKAARFARQAGDRGVAAAIRARADLYRQQQPCRDPAR